MRSIKQQIQISGAAMRKAPVPLPAAPTPLEVLRDAQVHVHIVHVHVGLTFDSFQGLPIETDGLKIIGRHWLPGAFSPAAMSLGS